MRRAEIVQLEQKKKTLARLTLNEHNLFSDLKFSAISTIYVHNTYMPIDGYLYFRIYTHIYESYVTTRVYTFAMLLFARKREMKKIS